jgi:hypothetical protein
MPPHQWSIFAMVRVLSLVLDLMFFSSLAILVMGGLESQFALLPITFVLSGVIVQAILLRGFKLTQPRLLYLPLVRRQKAQVVETKNCQYCNRAISADAKICRFCLTEVDKHPASSAPTASQQQPSHSGTLGNRPSVRPPK